MKKRALRIEHADCWGCKACEVACKQENGMPDGIKLIDVSESGPDRAGGNKEFIYLVNLCRHCSEPACLAACAEGAITQRDDNIVFLDGEKCSGCRACLDACPYDAIVFDENMSKACKCNLCLHRVDQGLLPACADNICLGQCIIFESGGTKNG